jgi:phage FluMu protein Com
MRTQRTAASEQALLLLPERLGFVIAFKCKNCGQLITVTEDYAGQRGKCPKCKTTVTVPNPRIAGAAENQRTTAAAAGPSAPKASSASLPAAPGRTTAQTALLAEGTAHPATGALSPGDRLKSLLLPSYDEVTMFLMSVTVVLVTVCNPSLRDRLIGFIFSVSGVFFGGAYILIYICGLVLSIYHIFSSRAKNQTEKYLMLFFAVFTNGTSAMCAGFYLLEHAVIWLAVFPIWNIVSGAVLILMLWFDIVDRRCVSDREATIPQAILGLAALVAVFFACSLLLKFHWAITFSICIAYSTSLDRAVSKVFRGKSASD